MGKTKEEVTHILKALFERAFAVFGPTLYIRAVCLPLAPKETDHSKREREREKKEERAAVMAWTNFVITGAAIVAVASLMRSDVRTSTAMLRRNVKTLRQMMEEAVSNTNTNNASSATSAADAANRSAKEEATKKLKK